MTARMELAFRVVAAILAIVWRGKSPGGRLY
jgi:hypothetical protein